MSGGFGLPVINLQNALGALGTSYSDAYDKAKKSSALTALGEKLKGGDYLGGAAVAFDGGDPAAGLGLLKLAQQARKDQLGLDATRDLAGSFGLGGPQAPAAPANGIEALSGGRQGSAPVPSFLDVDGPSGSYLPRLFTRESNNNDLAQAPTSSARGAGQFTRGTWNAVAAQHPDLGLTPVGDGQDGRTDRDQMIRATQAHTSDNEGLLRGSKLPVNDATRYSLHIFGAGGGRRFVAGTLANPDAPASSYVDPKQVAANRAVFFRRDGTAKSAGEVMGDFARSFGGDGAPQRQAGSLPPGVSGLNPDASMQRQVASADPQADLPAPGSEPAQFVIPPGGAPRAPGGLPSSSAQFPGPAGSDASAVPTLGGDPGARAMRMPGQEPVAPSAPIAPDTMVGNVPARAIMGAQPTQRIQALQRALLNPNTPDGVKQFATTMLKQTLDEAKMPDGVKEFLWARANGLTQAGTPGAYAQEKLRSPGADLTAQIGARETAARRLGMDPASEEFRDYALGYKPAAERQTEAEKLQGAARARRQIVLDQGGNPDDPRSAAFIRTGKDPREDQPFSASDKKVIIQAEDQALQLDQTIDTLSRAKELNPQTYTGYGAKALGMVGTSFPGAGMMLDPKKAEATREFGQIMSMEAIKSMSQTLKGATTDREMDRFVEILGDPTTPPAIRSGTIDRMLTLAQRQRDTARTRYEELRGGDYYRPGGGASAGSAPRSGGGSRDARALPSPSPSNRPGAASAGDRFGQLVGSGMSKAQAYQQLHSEGY